MAKVLHYFAHPGQRYSKTNREMWRQTAGIDGVTRVDLYAEYPRFDINIDREQERLRAHDVILFQFPLFWYSCPALLKEWQDLVLEYGFAYGENGTELAGKALMLALTTGGPEEAYGETGYNHFDLRTLLTPWEQTARLCQMTFLPPYVLFAALKAPQEARAQPHIDGFTTLLKRLQNDPLSCASDDPKALLQAVNLLQDETKHG